MDIRTLKGVGEKTAALFEKLHVYTAEELVSYYPRDYEQFSVPVPLDQAPVEEVTAVEGRLLGFPSPPLRCPVRAAVCI